MQVTRIPQPGIVTCKTGGFVASGEAGADKWTVPFLPKGMEMIKNEGSGQVQTTVQIPLKIEINL